MSGTLFLLPNLLDENLETQPFLPAALDKIVSSLDGCIGESEKGARRYLRRFLSHDELVQMPLKLLNEHTQSSELNDLLRPIIQGESWGVVTDAGLPCIADPGAALVRLAREHRLTVRAIPGPCSPIMALQLSGLNGQSFCFHGYLPRDERELREKIIQLERRANQDRATQLWMETPYRSLKMAEMAIETLRDDTIFCIAQSLTTIEESVQTKRVSAFRKEALQIKKVPTIFLLSQPNIP